MEADELITARYKALEIVLDERQRRLYAAAEAKVLGHGGVKRVHEASGVARGSILAGLKELERGAEALASEARRVRRAGAGRKRLVDQDPGVREALERLVEPVRRGDPESPLRWTCKSLMQLARELNARGHTISHVSVGALLKELGYSLQGNRKTLEGGNHPDRDAQFEYISGKVEAALCAGQPVISVDTKKKELVGQYQNGGKEWRPQGQPEDVKVHDFVDDKLGRANPYGVYDLGSNSAWVSVGTDHDTSAFAAQALRRWWRADGSARYPHARRLLICADSGGSNAARSRAWKVQIARLAAETGLTITVCHYPPGTSKWNKVEHRLFAQITRNWRGRPLVSHQAVIELISATTTTTGLTVHAELDTGSYETGLTYTPRQIAALPITRHDFHGDWNYTVRPEPHETPVPTRKQTTRPTKHQLILRGC